MISCSICPSTGCPVEAGRICVGAYGAKGDQITDDSGAFQAAITAALQVGGGMGVPRGTYRVGGINREAP
jgi:polygalacturonase